MISELVHDARESLLIVSFAAFGVSDVVNEIKLAVQRGVRVDLVLETTTSHGGALHGSVGAADAFEAIRRNVAIKLPGEKIGVLGASAGQSAVHDIRYTSDMFFLLVVHPLSHLDPPDTEASAASFILKKIELIC